MAQDSDLPKPAAAADKGKGKAVDDVKDDKAVADGKKKEDDKKDGIAPPLSLALLLLDVQWADFCASAAEEELNEEDQQLKSELDMMVERLTVSIAELHDSEDEVGRRKMRRGAAAYLWCEELRKLTPLTSRNPTVPSTSPPWR